MINKIFPAAMTDAIRRSMPKKKVEKVKRVDVGYKKVPKQMDGRPRKKLNSLVREAMSKEEILKEIKGISKRL